MNEIFEFLQHERLDVRNEAVKIISGLTGDKSNFPLFEAKDCLPIKLLMDLVKGEALTSHSAINALINLSAEEQFAKVMANSAFIFEIVSLLVLPTNVNADLLCILLNNMSKHDFVISKLLPLTGEGARTGPQILDNLLEVFVRGSSAVYNPKAGYHFLASVFANISAYSHGAMHYLDNSTVDSTSRLSKLIIFTEHENQTRRAGVILTLKNICLRIALEKQGLNNLFAEELNFLVYLLLPLAGPEDYEEHYLEGMPDELQFLEADKKRESDPKLRIALIECLIAIASEYEGREYLRKKQVYPVIRKLHEVDNNEVVKVVIEKLVNLLMRDESQT